MADTFDGNIAIKLTVDAKSGKVVIEKVNKQLGETEKHLTNMHKKSKIFFTHFQKSLIVLNQAAELFRKMAQFAQVLVRPITESGQFEQYRMVLKNLIGDIDEADARFKEMIRFAARTPFNVPGIVEAGNRLQALGKYSLDTIENLGDLAAAAGKDVMQAVEAYTNLVTGRTGIAIKQFRALLISTRDWEREIGKVVLKTGKGVKASIDEMLGALPEIIKEKNFAGLMEEQAKTLLGMLSNLEDNFQQVMASIGDVFLQSTKNLVVDLIDLLEWVKVNIDAIIGTFEEFGKMILWVVSGLVFGAFMKGMGNLVKSVVAGVVVMKKFTLGTITATKALKKFNKVAAFSAFVKLALVVVLVVEAFELFNKTVNKSTDDLIRLNEQSITNTKTSLESAKATKKEMEQRLDLVDSYISMLTLGRDMTKVGKDNVAVIKDLRREFPSLRTEVDKAGNATGGLTTDLEELMMVALDLEDQIYGTEESISELTFEVAGLIREMRTLEVEKVFKDFADQLFETEGIGDVVSNWISVIVESLKPENFDEISDTLEGMGRDWLDKISAEISSKENLDDLRTSWDDVSLQLQEGVHAIEKPELPQWILDNELFKKFKASMLDQGREVEEGMEGLVDVDVRGIWGEMPEQMRIQIARLVQATKVWNQGVRNSFMWIEEIDPATGRMSEAYKRYMVELRKAYQLQRAFITSQQLESETLVSDKVKVGLDSISDIIIEAKNTTALKLKQSPKVEIAYLEEYSEELRKTLELLTDIPDEIKKSGDISLGDKILEDILPQKEDFESTEEYDKEFKRITRFIYSVVDSVLTEQQDRITTVNKQIDSALDETKKERNKWLKKWQDQFKGIKADFDIEEATIKGDPTLTEKERGEALIALRFQFGEDLLALQKAHDTEYNDVYDLEWEERNGKEKKYLADIKVLYQKQAEEQVAIYTEMYENLAIIREAGAKGIELGAEAQFENAAAELESFKNVIMKFLGEAYEGMTFEDLKSEDLAKVAVPLLQFLSKLKNKSVEAGTAVAELYDTQDLSAFISGFSDMDYRSLDEFAQKLNDSKDLILLNGVAVEEIGNIVRETKVDLQDAFVFGDADSLNSILSKSEALGTQIEKLNTQRMGSIALIKDEDQRAAATFEAEKIYAEQLQDLYKATFDALSGKEFTLEEKTLFKTDPKGAEELKTERLQIMQQYEGDYEGMIQALNELDVNRKQWVLDLDFKMWAKRLSYASEFVGQMQNITNSLMQMAQESADREVAIWKGAQLERLDIEEKQMRIHARTRNQELRIAETYEANKEVIELEADRKKYEKLKGWFELNKALEIVQIGIATAGAVMKNRELFGELLAIPMNILTIAAGAAQAALVASKQMPEPGFREGGYTGDISKNKQAGIVHGQEFVFDADDTKENRPLFEKLSKDDLGGDEKSILKKIGEGKLEEIAFQGGTITNITNVQKPSLVGQNSIIDIRKDMELSRTIIDSNGELKSELIEIKSLLKKYLQNPIAPVITDKAKANIVSKGVQIIRRRSI